MVGVTVGVFVGVSVLVGVTVGVFVGVSVLVGVIVGVGVSVGEQSGIGRMIQSKLVPWNNGEVPDVPEPPDFPEVPSIPELPDDPEDPDLPELVPPDIITVLVLTPLTKVNPLKNISLTLYIVIESPTIVRLSEVKPVMIIVPPVLLYNSNVVVEEKYVPPVKNTSLGYILHLASCLETLFIPSIVDPVQASISAWPAGLETPPTLLKTL